MYIIQYSSDKNIVYVWRDLRLHLFKKNANLFFFFQDYTKQDVYIYVLLFTSFYQTLGECNRINQRFDAVSESLCWKILLSYQNLWSWSCLWLNICS